MPHIRVEAAKEGDVLSRDVMIEDVLLFESGTVLVKKTLEILTILGVDAVYVEHRDETNFTSIKEAFANIEKRFSYVEKDKLMSHIKHIVKDTLSNIWAIR